MSIHRYGRRYARRLRLARAKSRVLLANFIWIAEEILKNGGEVSCEWPRYCTGWMLPELVDFICRHSLYTANLDGCAVGLTDAAGTPIKKLWRFVCSNQRLALSLDQ
eukprot:11303456-Karenia_brevis.AAC.1